MVVIKIGFVGAGTVNFGGSEGPWDHASRLEKIDDVVFVGIADYYQSKAQSVLELRRARPVTGDRYADCKAVGSIDDLLKLAPDVIFIGTEPGSRGCIEKPLELQALKAGCHVFVEKPLSVVLPDDFSLYSEAINQMRRDKSKMLSVGYMFRYHVAIRKMKELIKNHGGHVMSINLEYCCTYSAIDRSFWWDKTKSGGPIVEQATHFCDLARFLGGEIDLASVQTTCLFNSDPGGAGKLSHMAAGCEENIAPNDKIPRVTSSQWHYINGGVGSLMHCATLVGKDYETSITVQMDGLRMCLTDLYTSRCQLSVRDCNQPGDNPDRSIVYSYPSDDPYDTEVKEFLAAIATNDSARILSPYEDAAKTYQFSWKIRQAGEATRERLFGRAGAAGGVI